MLSDEEDLLIVVDHREAASGIIEELEKDQLFVIRKANLSCGDYLIGDLAIERKRGSDFHRSIEDGRFFSQLFLMKRRYRRRLLLMEAVGGMACYEAILAKVTAGLQIPILYSTSTLHSALLIKRIALQIFKLNVGSPVLRHIQRKQDLQFQQRYILLGLPGIGLKRADALLKQFGSLGQIFMASEKELAQTPEVGPGVARRIREILAAGIAEINSSG